MAAFLVPTVLFPRLSGRAVAQTRRPGKAAQLLRRQAVRAMLGGELAVQTLPALAVSAVSPALSAAKLAAGPGINLFNFVMIVRIILTWYPQANLAKVPWIYIAVPTEPLLRVTRKVIPPVGGVDISPIVWFALMSFVHEILVGPQGLLVLLERQ